MDNQFLLVTGINHPEPRADRMGIYTRDNRKNDGRWVWTSKDGTSSLWYAESKKQWIIGNVANVGTTTGSIYCPAAQSSEPADPALKWSRWNGKKWEHVPALKVQWTTDSAVRAPSPEPDEGDEASDYEVEPPPTVSDDLGQVVLTSTFSDVIFTVAGASATEDIPGHRIILAAHSPVLASMLYPNELEREALGGVIPLPVRIRLSLEPKLFKDILTFLYTDKLNLEPQNVDACLAFARKYCIPKLKALCATHQEKLLKVSNVLSYFNKGPEVFNDDYFGLTFIERHAQQVFKSDISAVKKDRLQVLLASNNLMIREADLFQSVLAWGKAHSGSGKDAVRETVKDLLPLIRFPLLTSEEFSTLVLNSGVLTDEQEVELMAYLACKECKSELGESYDLPPIAWNSRPRLSLSFQFSWDKCGEKGRIINNRTTYESTSGGYSCVLGNRALVPNSGKYYWEIKVDNIGPNGGDWQCAIGVGTEALNLNNYLSANTSGWAYFNQGCRCHNSGSSADRYGKPFGTGNIIGVLFDSNEGTLSYYVNKSAQGVAFNGIKGVVYPAGHVNAGVSITIMQEVEAPPEAY